MKVNFYTATTTKILFIVVVVFLIHFDGYSQTDSTKMTVEEMTKQRQNPVAGLRSIYLQDVLLPVGEGNANSFSVQPVFPIKLGSNLKMITYTIIPFQTLPPLYSGDNKESGMGNILFNGYLTPIQTKGKTRWGIGPAIQLPTRTNAALGSNRVAMGPTALFYPEQQYKSFLDKLNQDVKRKTNFIGGQYLVPYERISTKWCCP